MMAVIVCALLCLPATRRAAGDVGHGSNARPAGPLAVVSVASVDGLLEDIDYLFETANRPGVARLVRGIVSAFGDLKGLDRERPLGAMIVLQPGVAPRPVVVAFVPVRDVEELIRTVSIGTEIRAKGADDRYEIVTPQRTLHARLTMDYAFVAAEREVLDRRLPDPAELTRELAGRYDLAASIRLDNVPAGMKTLVIDYLRARAAAELEPRDGESEAWFRFRKLTTESALQTIEQTLTQGEALTLGWTLSREEKSAAVEFEMTAVPETPLAADLERIGAQGSRFPVIASESGPLSLSLSWTLDDRTRAVLTQALRLAREETHDGFGTEAGRTAAATVCDVIEATVRAGRVDLALQLAGEPPGPLTLAGTIKVAGGAGLAESLPPLLEGIGSVPNIETVELDAERHNGIALHRVIGRSERPAEDRIFGTHPHFYIGADANTLWFGIGQDAPDALKQAIDWGNAPHAGDRRGPPLRLVVRAREWMAAFGSELTGPPSERELLHDAFAGCDDALRVEVVPAERGARLRLQFDEGFVRLSGRTIVRRVDRR